MHMLGKVSTIRWMLRLRQDVCLDVHSHHQRMATIVTPISHRPFTAVMGLIAALVVVPGIGIAAPSNGSGPQKTDKQCKDDRAKCMKDCDHLIDIDNNIQRCKDRCTDAYIICTPLRGALPGNKFDTVRPFALPKQNAPIMRRGLEDEQPPKSPVPATTGSEENAK